ncbi:5-bromo-4-chloroindolyl phosphate hydrolysis family protein [Romboutsia lituseburensis]|uniref:5-bromo-4-chloroindolyl phosphate hydrolysis protein n=1 Tax=Romboutsia lituseburensis DSM 797 TaxID=1121325 RepID=A0A1G9T355_9FIRM|nr:5-bromo-4-chloroindolyl phosphate hydrolysis family protein [Romboutsia lituseburensis]CEH36020.1 5-bromo-4-chloroindolyl phosphate hydrolysis protein [Romboutsia lituseburensis]SDM42111.1 5-bromo-4-chloroindolyl phosphate hydrolysis protein [Romboutsia lituseburensis DSM 797]
MNKKDFSDLEDQIMSTVSNALKAIDFANLKRDITDKTEDTLNQFKSKFNGYSEKYMILNRKSKNDVSAYISKRPSGSISGILYILFGVIGSLVFGFSVITTLVFKMLFSSVVIISSNIILGVVFLFFAVSLGMLLRGMTLRKRVKRFKKYVRFIDDNSYFLISDLAKFAKEKESFVIKDLNKMIGLGMFLEGHIDEEKTYFMLNNEVYSDYLNLKKQQIAKEIDNEKSNEEIYNSEKEEKESIIRVGRSYIEQIKQIRNDLYKEEIAIKLDKLGNIANQILNQIEKNPKKIQEVNKFINHYLPITIKLINSYKDINNQLIKGENIENAKIEIEKSIDLINTAFENLLDDLFEDVVLDVSTDISVLKTLFKQEGLVEEDFKK